jgi:transposase
MAGKSPVAAGEEQKAGLRRLAVSRDRGEADRARALLLTLSGWTSPRIAEAFGVREDTVRLWRSDFARGGVEALETSPASGPAPVKAEAALRVVAPLLEAPVADRRNWTLARLIGEIEAREGVTISKSRLSKVLRKKIPLASAATHSEGPPGRRRHRSRRPQAGAAQGAGGGRRYRAPVRRRERGADASLPGQSLG